MTKNECVRYCITENGAYILVRADRAYILVRFDRANRSDRSDRADRADRADRRRWKRNYFQLKNLPCPPCLFRKLVAIGYSRLLFESGTASWLGLCSGTLGGVCTLLSKVYVMRLQSVVKPSGRKNLYFLHG
jgi:hypothetical protein